MSDEKKKVISILRSLIISSPQKGKSQRDLVRDYFEFVGEKIPTFEFETVEKFLRGSGEFVLENFRGETIVYEKPNAERFVTFLQFMMKTLFQIPLVLAGTFQNWCRNKVGRKKELRLRTDFDSLFAHRTFHRNVMATLWSDHRLRRFFRRGIWAIRREVVPYINEVVLFSSRINEVHRRIWKTILDWTDFDITMAQQVTQIVKFSRVNRIKRNRRLI